MAASQVLSAKEKFLREVKSATPVNIWKTRKQNSFTEDMKKVLVVWIEDQAKHSLKPKPNTEEGCDSLQFYEG